MKHDVVGLFASLARSKQIDIGDESAVDVFTKMVANAFRENRKNAALVHGQRTEALFEYVVGGLGGARLLKQEDQGEAYASDDILVPDYRVQLNSGTRLLVEVKNVHKMASERCFRLRKSYVARLQRYAAWDDSELKFAIYYSRWAQWVLLPLGAFDLSGESYEIGMTKAFKRSEMAVLGDYMVGTTPDLEVFIESEPNSSLALSGGRYKFHARRISFFCRGVELTNSLEKKLAFYFTRFGRWEEKEALLLADASSVKGIRFVFSPIEKTEGQEFYLLGAVSTMISSAFGELTAEKGQVRAITIDREPADLAILIPEDYASSTLPLMRLIQRPIFDEDVGDGRG